MDLRKDYQTIRGLNAEILAVSNDQLTGAERAIDHLDLGFPALFDPEAVVIERFDVYGTPKRRLRHALSFVIDKNGDIRWEYVGRHYNDRPTNQQVIAQLEALQME